MTKYRLFYLHIMFHLMVQQIKTNKSCNDIRRQDSRLFQPIFVQTNHGRTFSPNCRQDAMLPIKVSRQITIHLANF